MLWLTAAHRSVDGVWIGAYSAEQAEAALQRVEAALRLIKTCDPLRYDRLRHDLDRIWVRKESPPTYAAHFSHTLRACMIDVGFALAETTDASILAATIVHEATHARLWHCGFGYEEEQRHRVEAICMRRELAFARRLPDAQCVREHAEARLAMPPSYFSDAAFQARKRDGHIAFFADVKPRWLGRLFLALYEAGLRRAERRQQRQE